MDNTLACTLQVGVSQVRGEVENTLKNETHAITTTLLCVAQSVVLLAWRELSDCAPTCAPTAEDRG